LIIKGVEITPWGNYPIFGNGNNYSVCCNNFLTFLIFYLLLKKYFDLSGKERIKIQYFILGTFLFTLVNLICNIILVPWWKYFPYYYIGNYSALFLIGFTGYAIIKRKLFGIDTILAAMLVIFIAILLLFDILILTEDFVIRMFKFILLIAYLYFGHTLVNNVLKENKRKKKMEKLTRKLKITNTEFKQANRKIKKN